MIESNIEILIVKYFTNQINSDELHKLSNWLKDENNKLVFEKFVELNFLIEKAQPTSFIDKGQVWSLIEKRVRSKKIRRINKYVRYVAAASIVLFISVFLLTKTNKEVIVPNTPIIVDNNILIGTDKATLTLSDGTNVELEKGKNYVSAEVESDGEALIYKKSNTKDQEVVYNYLTIPRGGQFFIELNDGTNVWLNSESQLKYPVTFPKNKSREVQLVYGEAYFEVSPSTNHNGSNFIVDSNNQKIEVLGTEFNIKAYQNEAKIYTTLVEGKVSVSKNNNSKILKPGEQSIINSGNIDNQISVVNADVYSETIWRRGFFSFKDKTLKEIMVVLARWYDIEVEYNSEELKDIHFKGVLSKNQNIEEILTNIKHTNFIETYEITGNKILIK